MPIAYTIKMSDEAEHQIQEIYDYIAIHSPRSASRMARKLREMIDSLSSFPDRFHIFEDHVDPDQVVRSVPVKSFIVYYIVYESLKRVDVVMIRHGARDRPPRFFR